MKICVSGATGFIGKHVVSELISTSTQVSGIIRSERNKLQSETVDWVNLDIADLPEENIFELIGRPDVLIHLAWGGLPNYKSLYHFETELPIQYAFIKRLVSEGLKSIVVSGTCFEFGLLSGQLSERDNLLPSSSYGLAKYTLLQQLQFLQKQTPFNLTWARLFYMFGEGQAGNSLLPQLERAIQSGEKSFNMSGGEQLRDYMPVNEVAIQLVKLAKKQQDLGVVHVCSGKPISVRSLVENIIHSNGWEIKLNLGYYPYTDYEPMAFWGDKTKLNSLTGY
jgi:nucleoside-diphosphate-sugar epimerase